MNPIRSAGFYEPSLNPSGPGAWKASDGTATARRTTGPDGWPCIEVTSAADGSVTWCPTLDAALRAVSGGGA